MYENYLCLDCKLCCSYGYLLVVDFWGCVVVDGGMEFGVMIVVFDCNVVVEVWFCILFLIYDWDYLVFWECDVW